MPLLDWLSEDIRVLIAGAAAGAISRTVVSPLERIKIEFQVQDVLYKDADSAFRTKRTLIGGLMQIYEREGVKGWFKGNMTNVVRIIPYSSSQFLVYEKCKDLLVNMRSPENRKTTPLDRMLAGGAGGVASVVVSYPWDFVRARLTTQGEGTIHQYRGIWDAMATISREEGVATLYKGVWVSIIGIYPYIGTNFMVYGTLKDWAVEHYKVPDANKLPWSVTFAIGGFAGAAAQTVAYPFDLLRRRIQVEGFGIQAAARAAESKEPSLAQMNMFRAMAHIARTEGFSALYKGLLPNYLKVFPTMAVSFWVYERCREYMGLADSK